MGERVNRDIQRQLLSVIRTDALAVVASIIGAERATKPVFAHYSHEVALVKQSFELNVALFIKAADSLDFVK
jgi:hypothetical protein